MDRFKLLFLLAFVCICQISAWPQYPIRGLFTKLSDEKTIQVFTRFANDSRSSYYGPEKISRSSDGFSVSLEMCEDGIGASAIIDGRPTKGICDNVCLLSNRLHIPHLTLDWEPMEYASKEGFTFSYHPSSEVISKAYANYIRKMEWERFSFLYEDEGSFIRLQEVINTWENDKKPILFKKLRPGRDNKETFKHVFKVARISYHIIDCKAENVLRYLEEITKVESYTAYQNILLTSLDAYTIDLSSIDIAGNVTTWHLTMANDYYKWTDIGIDNPKLTETHLAADALSHLEKSIRYMLDTMGDRSREISNPPALCYDGETEPWEMGHRLQEALRSEATSTKGFTGNIQFDENGKRVDFLLHYSRLNNESKFIYGGYWNSTTDKIHDMNADSGQLVKTKTNFRVVTKRAKPYYIPPKNDEPHTGYVVDLMDEIFRHIRENQDLDYTYDLVVGPGNKPGNPIEGSTRWDGLIGELMEHKADLAICDLTITSDRNAVVDFSIPFMSLGISMLFKVDPPPNPDMFSFVNPLSTDVWLYLAVVYILTSLVLLICARMSQEDWVNPHPCERNPKNLENIWSLYNCMWLTMGSIMTQGCDILPRGAGSRWIAGTWWFFAMIVTASYTANMSTFISNNRRSNEITSVKALSEQTAISYGAMLNGSTYKFFQTSNDPVYQKIFQVMSANNPTSNVFTTDNDEGVDRVLTSKGKFVFFMESSTIEYYMKQDCNLKMVGGKLDSKDYGIAMPKKSPFRFTINKAILALQESGKLLEIKEKWWAKDPERPVVQDCQSEESKESDESGSVQMKNTSGIFLVLAIGGISGLIVAIIGFFLHSHEIAVKEGISYKEALASEWRASLDPRVLNKPTAPPRSAAGSTESPSPQRERSRSRAASVLHFAQSFINLNEVY